MILGWCTSHVPDARVRITRSGRGVVKIIVVSSWDEQFLLHYKIFTTATIIIIINNIITYTKIIIKFCVIIIIGRIIVKRYYQKWWNHQEYKIKKYRTRIINSAQANKNYGLIAGLASYYAN